MKLKRCKSCGKEIAKNARICPHCGHKYSRISGCFAYTLIFVVVIFMISYVVSNLSNSKVNHNSSLSIKQIAQKENARVGQYQTMYRANTEVQNPDGSNIILNFPSIKKYQSYQTNKNQLINNVIVVQNVTDISVTRNYVKELAYFVLFKDNGEEIDISNDIYTQTGSEYSEIIIPLSNQSEYNSCKYILIGGFDKSSNNGKSKLIFTIN